ncbi:hypothetical protein [Mycobacteroides abscessus]|uniref:hypothetical protein n=1 Tax=Mycobacteroides abscessus TaxID=36809 RepID=UPI0003A753D7|nr:hypothetical protein [Mycobacteroides abscessus]QOF29667.1 hypothetical protein E3G43_003227 [Mycobacteroides abscessus]BBZ85091.1 hypothetical protein MABM_50070 [Mycobacteroides abscessus]
MSFYVEEKDASLRLFIPGSGVVPIAEAWHEAGDDGPAAWVVNPDGIAEHLAAFDVLHKADAENALRAIGYAYEAGGGGS